MVARLLEKYRNEVSPTLAERFGLKNRLAASPLLPSALFVSSAPGRGARVYTGGAMFVHPGRAMRLICALPGRRSAESALDYNRGFAGPLLYCYRRLAGSPRARSAVRPMVNLPAVL